MVFFLAGRENASNNNWCRIPGREKSGKKKPGRKLGTGVSPAQGRSLIPEPELRVAVIKVPVKQTVKKDSTA